MGTSSEGSPYNFFLNSVPFPTVCLLIQLSISSPCWKRRGCSCPHTPVLPTSSQSPEPTSERPPAPGIPPPLLSLLDWAPHHSRLRSGHSSLALPATCLPLTVTPSSTPSPKPSFSSTALPPDEKPLLASPGLKTPSQPHFHQRHPMAVLLPSSHSPYFPPPLANALAP